VRDLVDAKRGEREMWATGDYGAIARAMFWDVGARIVERVGVLPGDRVLDVACGTGNAAIRAAHAGGDVVGLDLTPELLAGRRLAAQTGVALDWVEGDAEALPFDDRSFDAWTPRRGLVIGETDRGVVVRALRSPMRATSSRRSIGRIA